MLPQSLVDLIPPRPPGHKLGRESFARSTGVSFDPFSPAASLVSLTLDTMLNQHRAARMNAFHAADPAQPDFRQILNALNDTSWYAQRQTNMAGAIQRITNEQLLHAQMTLVANADATSQVRAQALVSIQNLDQWLAKQSKKRIDDDWSAHYAKAKLEIKLWLEDPTRLAPASKKPAPPGSPIGA